MKNIDKFDNDIKISYMLHFTNMIVDQFLIYDKHLNINDFSYNHIVKGASEQVYLSDKEKELAIKNSKFFLRQKYGIEIISDNPITIKRTPCN